MGQEIKIDAREIMEKLARIQAEIEFLKNKGIILEEQQKKKFTIIDESMMELWDNEDDEIWNKY